MVSSDHLTGRLALGTPCADPCTSWVTVLCRGAASDAHESTGKPEPRLSARRERTPRAKSPPHIRGVRCSGPHRGLGGILVCVLG